MMAARTIAAAYPYTDESGHVLYESVRYDPKDFSQRVPLAGGLFAYKLNGVRRVPYRLREMRERIAKGHAIFVVEGEKDADALRALGFCATTSAQGCGWKWTPEFVEHFRGAPRVAVITDCDEGDPVKGGSKGREAARDRAALLRTVVDDVRLVDLAPDRHDGYDVSDWLAEGHGHEELMALVEATRPISSATQTVPPEFDEQPHLVVTRADAIRVERVEWLAHERVPLGGITLFDGPGGIGKTTFLTGIIAAATRGRDFFTGAAITPQTSLVVGVEDRRALIAARLKLYGADMTRVHLVDATRVGGRDIPLTLPDHVGALERTILELGVGFVYVDALFSHIAIDGEGRMAQQVRSALQPIGDLCERRSIAFAAMRHWTKAAGSALSRALGSVEFTNYARSVFTFGEHPSDADLVVCAHTKSNYAKLSSAVAFRRFAHDVIDDNGRPWQVAIAADVGGCDGVTSDDLTMRTPSDPDEKNTAAEWLRDYLADGQDHPAEEVYKAGGQLRIGSRSTISRAARTLGVTMARTSTFPSVGTWRLTIASEQRDSPFGQSSHSRVISQSVDSTDESWGGSAPQTLIEQGPDSRVTVASGERDASSVDAIDATEDDGVTPPKASVPSDDDFEDFE